MQTVGRLTENGPEAGPPRPAHTAAPLLMAWEQADLTVLGDVRLRCVPWAGPLFPSGLPTVADVQQRRHRGANSCYVLAALMAIAAQHPAYLGCMVGVCGTHSVQVTCYKNFTETLTTTHRPNRLQFTADLLSYKKLGRLHRLSTTGPALWPSFCEKAYALCHGGAHALTVPGHSVLPLQFFLGVKAFHAAILPQHDHLQGLAQLFLHGECLVLYDRFHHAHAVVGVRPAQSDHLPLPPATAQWEVEVLDPRAPSWRQSRQSRWLTQPPDLNSFVELACTQGAAAM
jgi:hypothetical protein